MNTYLQDIFYNTDKLNLKKKKQICKDALKVCYEWWADILDCNKSWQREKIEMDFEEILNKLTDASHFVIIHRRGYLENKNKVLWKWHLEVGFCTMTAPEYFLWIQCAEETIPFFVNKYKLTVFN